MAQRTSSIVQRAARHRRVRARVHGTTSRPRLAVFKSNRFIYAQIINDERGATLASASSQKITKGTPRERAAEVGRTIAAIAKEKKINTVVFDRGGFLYAGHIKAVADGAREGGLKF